MSVRLLNTPSLALLMGTMFALSLHLLRGYPALLLSALAIIAITLSGREHKLIWGAIGGAVMTSGWVNTLSPTAGLIGAVVGYTLLSIVSFLAGLEKLHEELALFKYPILSMAHIGA